MYPVNNNNKKMVTKYEWKEVIESINGFIWFYVVEGIIIIKSIISNNKIVSNVVTYDNNLCNSCHDLSSLEIVKLSIINALNKYRSITKNELINYVKITYKSFIFLFQILNYYIKHIKNNGSNSNNLTNLCLNNGCVIYNKEFNKWLLNMILKSSMESKFRYDQVFFYGFVRNLENLF